MDRIEAIRIAMEANGVKFLEASEETLNAAEEAYGMTMPQVLRDFYKGGVPIGSRFPEWLSGSEHAEKELRRMVHFPMRSIVTSVENEGFWPSAWGERPADSEIVSAAKEHLIAMGLANPLVPVVGHCYLICNGTEEAGPVISVFGDDVTVMGDDLYDFLEKRYGVTMRTPVTQETVEACGAWKALVG